MVLHAPVAQAVKKYCIGTQKAMLIMLSSGVSLRPNEGLLAHGFLSLEEALDSQFQRLGKMYQSPN